MRSTIVSAASLVSLLGAIPVRAADNDSDTYWPWQTYKSEPSLQPPALEITKNSPLSPGYLFFDQNGNYGHNYSCFIMTDDGDLVWQGSYGDFSAFKAQTLEGESVLTYFEGVTWSEPWGWGYGLVQILDDQYENIYNVSVPGTHFVTIDIADTSGFESWLDMHEDLITDEATMLTTAYNVTPADLTSAGGPKDGWIVDSGFFEIDIKTDEVLFEWFAADHQDQIPFADAVETYPLDYLGTNQTYPWGPFHINTVNKLEDGSYLISSRQYCSIFMINPDGSVAWTLNGRHGGNFTLGEGLDFCYQHDIRIHAIEGSQYTMSLFNNDNNADFYGVNQTTGIFMQVDVENWTATLLQELIDPEDPIYSHSQGNVQVLDDGHVIVGYGSTPRIKEYNPDGSVAMSVKFGPSEGTVFSYRAYRLPWVGKPNTSPKAVACSDENNQTSVYMSWNGATEYTSWKVYAGASQFNLTLATEAARTGFETSAVLPAGVSYVRADAYGLNGTLGASEVITVGGQC
ncbi:hypothetical protein E8E14_006558 [Neopestalotiopsis sp. 37M]|nr:hypothetical protein E8E14_006558 [Neopestalotiopsis sp. 37M]